MVDALTWLERHFAEVDRKRREAFNRLPSNVRDEMCKALVATAASYAAHAGGFNAEFSGTINTVAGVDADLVFEYCRERLRQNPLTMVSNINMPLSRLTATSNGEEIRVEVQGNICGVAVIYYDKNNVVAIDARSCTSGNSQAKQAQPQQPHGSTGNVQEARLTPTIGDDLEIELE